MCGICGIFDTERIVQRETLKAMSDTLRHRGPDDEGFYNCGGMGLAHRRLSIIDLEGGHQPLSNEDETIWIAFNGEIYNFEELNRRYLSSGHRFRTRSDTETIVHLYEELGEACFAEMRGMFAIALWDASPPSGWCWRGIGLGKSRCFTPGTAGGWCSAPRSRRCCKAGGISQEMDLEALSDYFSYQYIPAPKTIYRSVRKLRPAHYLVVEKSGIREVPYWDIQFNETRELSESEWCEAFLAEYRSAVKSRLISDVPLGAFLSGGVDSSSVVALMNEFQPPVTTCSIGFTEESYDEAADARKFAATLGANHFEHTVKAACHRLGFQTGLAL